MERIGIYGGTFDPIHTGHLITAQSILEQRELSKIFFIPCHISPHKTDKITALPEHRLEMAKLAIKNSSLFHVSDYEINMGEISYTLNTILEFRKIYDEIELIIGYDNLLVFDKWHKPDEILKHCDVVVMRRIVDNKPDIENEYFDRVQFVDTPMIEISSTDIRNRITAGKNVTNLVPAEVESYIHKHRLYR